MQEICFSLVVDVDDTIDLGPTVNRLIALVLKEAQKRTGRACSLIGVSSDIVDALPLHGEDDASFAEFQIAIDEEFNDD